MPAPGALSRLAARLAAPAGLLLLSGCQLGYYAHLLRGQADLLARREAIEDVLARPDTDPELRRRLAIVQDARRFAAGALGLPAGGSYTDYADLGRPFAMWSVFATPELSLVPHTWCHGFVGCLAYRGYYDEARALEEARALAARGFDVHVGGVPAYSTLGWFDDPVPSTVLHWPDDALAGVIFHELAHQRVFAEGDTVFNESYATFVQREGVRAWLERSPALAEAARLRQQRSDAFVALMLETTRRLEAIYASDLSDEDKRRRKHEAFADLRDRYRRLKRDWGGDTSYDPWFENELNNARLLPFGLYHEWIPAFAALFRKSGGDWDAFHDAAGRLAERAPDARNARLRKLRDSAGIAAGD